MAGNTKSTVTTLADEAPDTPAPAAARALAGANFDPELSGRKKTITIHQSDAPDGSFAVPVSVNGIAYQIPRGKPCVVPEEVVEVLTHAMQTHYTPIDGVVVAREVPRFAFSVLG